LVTVEQCIPAVGQGAIALECRADDTETIALLKTINHRETEIAVVAERSFMRTIGGGCKFPLAAHAVINGDTVTLNTIIGNDTNGDFVTIKESASIKDAEKLGIQIAEKMQKACKEKGIPLLIC
jgi:hydroxymethylbilane synthase